MFLDARFGSGADVVEPYKRKIDRWLWPNVLCNQDKSVSQAKRAIADYKKAVTHPWFLRSSAVPILIMDAVTMSHPIGMRKPITPLQSGHAGSILLHGANLHGANLLVMCGYPTRRHS